MLGSLVRGLPGDVGQALRFDAATFDGFHLYDIDFRFRAYRAGYRRCATNPPLPSIARPAEGGLAALRRSVRGAAGDRRDGRVRRTFSLRWRSSAPKGYCKRGNRSGRGNEGGT